MVTNMYWTKAKLGLTAAAAVMMMIGVAGCEKQNPPSPYGGIGMQNTFTPESTTMPETTDGGMGVSGMALPGGLSGLAGQTKEHAVNFLNASVDNLQTQFDQLKDQAQRAGIASSAQWKAQATKFTSSVGQANTQIQSLSSASAQQWQAILPQARQSVTDAGIALKSLAGMVGQAGQNMLREAMPGGAAATGSDAAGTAGSADSSAIEPANPATQPDQTQTTPTTGDNAMGQ